MSDAIRYNQFIDNSPDNKIWRPILDDEKDKFLELIHTVENLIETGTKKEKGDSLEELMTFIYQRFTFIDVIDNERKGDNQIDHIVRFIDGLTPTFIHENVGLTLVGESKNHKVSISVREVADLNELLRSKRSKMGIFSSIKSFSKGRNSRWVNAEGKRRKLALSSDKIIIGFTLIELKTLITNNFFTMIKQKFQCIVDEVFDDNTDEECYLPYQDRLHKSLFQLHHLKIITFEDYSEYKKALITKYGALEEK